jgi:ComF family protein
MILKPFVSPARIKDMKNLFYLVREFFFPGGCGVCGRMLFDAESSWYGFCPACRAGFTLEYGKRCGLCGRPLISETGFCLSCRGAAGEDKDAAAEPRSYDRLFSLFPYTGNYGKLLRAFKFGKSLGAGHLLADKVYEALGLLELEKKENPVLVPVPPRPGKIRKTGWDQIEWLARILERKGPEGLPVRRCLRRAASETQKKLGREKRLTNLKGRISARGKVPQTAVLFDDVLTTGSTMEACAGALKAAGARKVYGICLFYD